MENCIFCKIASSEILSEFLYESDNVFVIKDLYPKAKVHYLIIPKKHISTITDLEDSDSNLIWEMFLLARDIAKKENINWYKLQFNVWKDWWQEIMHIHLHFLAN